MEILRNIAKLPSFRKAVITVGTFDGVHSGHAKIIDQLKKEAAAIDGESVIVTFDPHPRLVIDPEGDPVMLLNSMDEKIELLEEQGVDHLVIVPFTHEFANIDAEAYVENFLVNNFHPHTIIIGYDHHFGKGRKGNYKLLEKLASEFLYQVKEIPGQVLNEVAISSTKIRNSLLKGDISTANEFLGYPYFFMGRVVKGDGIGKQLGYPTANLEIDDTHKLVPGDGVYAVLITMQTGMYKGMLSIGVRPTLEISRRLIEVNIFDLDEDLYDKSMRVYVISYVRGQEKFDSLELLSEQIAKDETACRKKLKKLG